jgi:phosphatidylserine/phosphatidylglycerophosphate/cardiolipin synthase-like enzyme
MVIDELIVVAGSFNYTQPANEFNDQNIFLMGSTHTRSKGRRWKRTPAGSWPFT